MNTVLLIHGDLEVALCCIWTSSSMHECGVKNIGSDVHFGNIVSYRRRSVPFGLVLFCLLLGKEPACLFFE